MPEVLINGQDLHKNALVMSDLESQALWPAKWIRVKAWLMVAYCIEKSGLEMTLLIIRICELCGEDRLIFRIFLPREFSSGGSGGPVMSSVTTLAVVCSGTQARSAGGGLVDVSGLFMEVE